MDGPAVALPRPQAERGGAGDPDPGAGEERQDSWRAEGGRAEDLGSPLHSTVMAGRQRRPPMSIEPAVAARPRGYSPACVHGSPGLTPGDDDVGKWRKKSQAGKP